MEKKAKILFLTNLPAPYTTNFFNELGKEVDLTVLYERKNASNQHESWKNFKVDNYKAIFLKGIKIKVEYAFAPFVCRHLKRKYDAIIVGNFCSPTGMLAVFHMKLFKIPYILFSEGGFAKDGKGFKERLKKKIIKNAKLYLSSSNTGDKYFTTYGADKNLIERIPFTSLYQNEVLKIVPTQNEILSLRKELDLDLDKKIIIAVGRFVAVKAFENLLEASSILKTEHQLLLVGAGPEIEKYQKIILEKELTNVKILGYMDRETLNKYYRASDLFVLPTRSDTWGLVIIEAMAQALPIVTTTSCVAGVEFIKENVNGSLVEKDDINALVISIDKLLEDETKKTLMKKNNLKLAEFQTYEKMVEVHLNIFKKYMNRIKK